MDFTDILSARVLLESVVLAIGIECLPILENRPKKTDTAYGFCYNRDSIERDFVGIKVKDFFGSRSS